MGMVDRHWKPLDSTSLHVIWRAFVCSHSSDGTEHRTAEISRPACNLVLKEFDLVHLKDLMWHNCCPPPHYLWKLCFASQVQVVQVLGPPGLTMVKYAVISRKGGQLHSRCFLLRSSALNLACVHAATNHDNKNNSRKEIDPEHRRMLSRVLLRYWKT